MGRVEGVAEIAESLAVVALSAPIEPDGEESQQGQSLTDQEEGLPEEVELISEPAEDLHIDIPQAEQLTGQLPPLPTTEKVDQIPLCPLPCDKWCGNYWRFCIFRNV